MGTVTGRRAAYERARKRRSTVVATVSSLAVVTAIVVSKEKENFQQCVKKGKMKGWKREKMYRRYYRIKENLIVLK